MFRWVYPILLLFCLATAPNTFAATIRVPADQSTIQAGIDAAVDGDTVLVAPGTYAENVYFEGKRVIVKSRGGADSTTITAASGTRPVVSFTANEPKGAVLQGFTITGGTDSSGIYCLNSSPTILENAIRNNKGVGTNLGGGINLRNTLGSVVKSNRVFDNHAGSYGSAIHVGDNDASSTQDTIAYNTIYGNVGLGDIRVLGDVFGLEVNNNTISVVTYDGIAVQGGTVTVRNNIVLGAPVWGIYAADGGVILAEYNCTFANATNYNFVPGAGNIYQDAMFQNASLDDYRLLFGSPCINAGDPAPQYNDPDGSRNDMGAIYFDQRFPWAVNVKVGEVGNSNVVDHTPTISWSLYSPDSTTQVGYEVEIGTDSQWSTAEMWQSGLITSADSFCVYGGISLQDSITYFGRIRLQADSLWGVWRGFSFCMNSIPSVPSLRLPINLGFATSQQPPLIIRNSSDAENDSLFYTFEVSPDSFTSVIYGFTRVQDADSLTTLIVDSVLVENAKYWWRVRASDYYETSGYSPAWSFYVNSVNTAPTGFALVEPTNALQPPVTTRVPQFIWNPASDPDPFDSVRYTHYLAIDSNFTYVHQVADLLTPDYVPAESLFWGTRYWWKVKASDLHGGVTWSDQVFTFRTMTLGDPNGNGMVNISDAVYLINYIFSGGAAPNPLLAGDADCNGFVNISDAVYLIAYIFSGGPAPCEGF